MKTKILGIAVATLISFSSAFAGVEPIDEIFEPAGTFDPATHGKVAVVQWAPGQSAPVGAPEADIVAYKKSVQDELEAFIREAAGKGAKWVVTPEFGLTGYPDIPELPSEEDEFQTPDQIRPFAEAVPGPYTTHFGALAKELGIWLQIGFAENGGDAFYNVAVVINPLGEVVTKYRKINLFQLENDFLKPGLEAVTYESPWGKVGLIICADVYSSNPMNAYKLAAVDVLALSTSWARYNSGWSAFTSGAMNAHAYLLAANQNYFPDSGVINPDGSAQSHIRQTTGIAYGFLPYKSIQQSHEFAPDREKKAKKAKKKKKHREEGKNDSDDDVLKDSAKQAE